MAITAFLSRSPGLLNRGTGGPASLGHVTQSSIFSPTDWTSGAPSYIIVQYPPSCGRHKSLSIQPVHGQGYILIFFDRMHLLFTQMHFLFWQLGWGQYVTSGGQSRPSKHTALFRSAKILRIVLEIKKTCYRSGSSERPSANVNGKNLSEVRTKFCGILGYKQII